MNDRRREYDFAYGCFLVCGLAALFGSLIEIVPKEDGAAALLGFYVALPLVLASFAALVGGIVQCIRLPKRERLVIMSIMSLLFLVALFTDHGSVTISVLYGLGVGWMSGEWFVVTRKGDGAMP